MLILTTLVDLVDIQFIGTATRLTWTKLSLK